MTTDEHPAGSNEAIAEMCGRPLWHVQYVMDNVSRQIGLEILKYRAERAFPIIMHAIGVMAEPETPALDRPLANVLEVRDANMLEKRGKNFVRDALEMTVEDLKAIKGVNDATAFDIVSRIQAVLRADG
jgi:hypothetical protein